jgi:hypothetical protein
MYGDGEYVVSFTGGQFQMAPLKATVIGPGLGDGPGDYAEVGFDLGAKQSVAVAAQAIAAVKRALPAS